MLIDANKAKALAFEPITIDVERGGLVFFAKAIGQDDPIYSDLDVAKAAGHPDLPVPPTFFFSLELSSPDPFAYLSNLGVDLRRVLHAEQSFTYHDQGYAGQTLMLQPKIADVFSKKGGALQFVVKQTEITRDGELMAEAECVIAVRNPELTA